MITPMKQVVTSEMLSSQIKGIKRALRDLYAERTELNKGNGFGN